jgi:HEAT repeat protein
MAISMLRGFPFAALFAFATATVTLPAQGKAAGVNELLARIAAAKGAERDVAAQELAALGSKAVPGLRRVLEDGEDAQRLVALFAIGKMGKSAEPLLPAMSKLWMVERFDLSQAIEKSFVALGAVGVHELARCVGEFGVQSYACQTLAEIGPAGKPAVPALGKLLVSRTAGANAAATALGAIRDPAAIPFLVKVVTEDAENPRGCDEYKVANSAQALGRIGPAAAAAVPALVKVMQAEGVPATATMCDRAATALGDIGVRTEPVLAALRNVAKTGSGDVKKAAQDSLEILECAVGSSDGAVARAICHANSDLRLLGLQRAVERAANGRPFVASIVWCYEHTDDVAVRMAAIGAIGAIGLQDEHVTRVLDAAAKHPDTKLAAAAQEVRAKFERKG